eukprot:3061590-Lingulodinium_polyedra.AAC.1
MRVSSIAVDVSCEAFQIHLLASRSVDYESVRNRRCVPRGHRMMGMWHTTHRSQEPGWTSHP